MKALWLVLSLLVVVAAENLAELTNLTWATFPAERYEYKADEKRKSYTKSRELRGLGKLYISLEKKKLSFKGMQLLTALTLSQKDEKYEFTDEEFELHKVIKLDVENYVFEGNRTGVFQRKVSGKIQISKNGNFAKVVSFEIKEFGQSFEGVMNEYVLLFSEAGRALRQEFRAIHFGSYYAALGDESVSY